MPEISQYEFSHTELMTILVKAAGLHEGRWMLLVNFNFSAGNFGATSQDAIPGALVTVGKLGLTKATPESPEGLVVDASAVNPTPAS